MRSVRRVGFTLVALQAYLSLSSIAFSADKSFWQKSALTLDVTYDLNYTLLTYPKQDRQDEQEVGLSISHPYLLPEIGWSRPEFYWGLYYLWPADGVGEDRAGGNIEGDGIMRYRAGVSTTHKVSSGSRYRSLLRYN